MGTIRLIVAVAVFIWCGNLFAQEDVTSLLIARPNSYGYGFDKKVAWIGGAAEAGLYGKFDIMSSVPVISTDRVAEILPEVLQYKTRISKLQYTSAAATLGASHLLYSEYEQTGKNEFNLHIQLVDVSSSETTVRETFNIKADRFRDGLDEIAAAVMSDDKFIPGASFVGNAKDLRKVGDCLTRSDELSGDDAAQAAKCLNGAVGDESPASHGFAARLYMRAGKYRDAQSMLRKLENSMGAFSPKIALMKSRCMLMQDDLGQAKAALSNESFPPSLAASVAYEKGLISEAFNDLDDAEKEYQQAAKLDPNDMRPRKRLAAVAFIKQDIQTAISFAQKVASSSNGSLGDVLVSIGIGLEQMDRDDAAMTAYNTAVEKEPENTRALLRLGKAQKASGDELAAAQSFIQLYGRDAIRYKDYLLEAASIYEKRGKTDEARKIYDDFLSGGHSDPEVRIKLASLEFRKDNCERVKSLLDRLEPPFSDDPKVNDMIAACRRKDVEQRTELTGGSGITYEEAQRGSALPRIIGVGTGIITVGAIAGGVISELLLQSELEEYRAARDNPDQYWIDKRKSITDKEKMRNLLYLIGATGAVGFGVNLVIAL